MIFIYYYYMDIMYNRRRIHTTMAKRYTKRAYKKRRTLRKLRVKHRNTQRGGVFLDKFKEFAAAGMETLNNAAATGKETLNKVTATGKETLNKVAAANPAMMAKLAATEAQARELAAAGQATASELAAAAKAKGREVVESNPAMMAKIAAAEAKFNEATAAGKETLNKVTAAGKAKVDEFAAANPKLMAGASGLIADGKAMVANGRPNAATVLKKTSLGPLTKTSLGTLNAFVALAKAMYSLMDMINIAKYYTSNPAFALEQLKEKTSEIKTNLRDTYPDIDTCITALQTAIESAPPQTSPPDLYPPESFNEKLKRLHNEISIDGVFKTINRDISAINAAMIAMNDMSKKPENQKPENQGLMDCFNDMKTKVLATVDAKKLSIISGITKLKNANPKVLSEGLKMVNAVKEIGANMGQRMEQLKAASVQAQAALGQGFGQAQAALGQGIGQAKAAVGQGIGQLQTAIEPARQQASQQVSAAMSSIKSGPSQAATAALDEVKKAAEEYAAKTQTAHQVAKAELDNTTKHINGIVHGNSFFDAIKFKAEETQYDMRKKFQTQIFNAAKNYADNAKTLLDKAKAAAAPQLSNDEREAALIELNNAAETNVVTTANLLKTATKLKADSITAKKNGGRLNTEATTFELNQNEIKSGNHSKEATANDATVQAIKAKVDAAAAAAGVTI